MTSRLAWVGVPTPVHGRYSPLARATLFPPPLPHPRSDPPPFLPRSFVVIFSLSLSLSLAHETSSTSATLLFPSSVFLIRQDDDVTGGDARNDAERYRNLPPLLKRGRAQPRGFMREPTNNLHPFRFSGSISASSSTPPDNSAFHLFSFILLLI